MMCAFESNINNSFSPPFTFSFVLLLELLRENKRLLDKSIRELDREITQQKNSERKLIVEIKKMAKQNQMAAVKVHSDGLYSSIIEIRTLYYRSCCLCLMRQFSWL